ncbi:hypothetical protein SAMN05216302_100583 [Nitrosomonas aestuarii]|uniref:Uncharacterized protein n=1 Tax=Nitrosomonas aestuarii TaxID=52441 RepID=A0A1I3Z5U6_9PROT|nr:hypothetical protein SAMN05216302_100583 [Nitrosomonas aestuarii]
MLKNKPQSSAKKLQRIQRNTESHWVGNSFPVRSLFTYPKLGPASIRIAVLKRSRLSIVVKLNIATAPEAAVQ